MGGLTFKTPGKDGEPALDTPRMPPAVYTRLREKYLELLSSKFYHLAVTPIESPEKDSYGDIDILVEGPRFPFTVQDLSYALHARRYNYDAADPTTNFAVPDTGEEEEEEAAIVYRQLDVHVCRPGMLDWEVFTKSHGDMWNILGSMGRFYGLTVNSTGCHVRIPQIEPVDRKRSLLFLTRDPAQTLLLFGLDPHKYNQGFGTLDEMFAYIASTRFFRHAAFENTEERRRDRQRMAQRPVFIRWVLEFLPRHADVLVGDPELTREGIMEEVLATFNKRAEYGIRLSEWNIAVAEGKLWKNVAAVIPLSGEKRALVVRGLKRIFASNGDATALESYGEGPLEKGREWVRRPDGGLDEERLLEWVGENWGLVKAEERCRVKRGKRERKEARERAAATGGGGEEASG
ncbi:MAG: hypothetical protein M1840_005966 [Geoglossum simile]|nr:MAG: hypothetical protein M1840_005966 [Geoglossum simile]